MMEPMLSSPGVPKDLVSPGFIYEPKLEGIRAFLIKTAKGIKLINRKGRDISASYPELLNPALIPADSCMLDGEILIFDKNGNPGLNLVLKREHIANEDDINKAAEEMPATFCAFDLLAINGKNMVAKTLDTRKNELDKLITGNARLQKVFYTSDGIGLWDFIMAKHLDGVVAKKKDSAYLAGKRTGLWLKIPNSKIQDCVIVGYTKGTRLISALGLAAYIDGKLTWLGKVGAGFSNKVVDELYPEIQKLHIDSPALSIAGRNEDINWVKPLLVCEVQFQVSANEGIIRNPVFLGMRPARHAKDCILDLPASKPGKVIPELFFAE
jgi:bifunctional non-homologous end joining protein LigD